jgi:altronate dehydratase
MTDVLTLHPDDDVALALRVLPGVPRGRKVAVHAIVAGAPVRKYGQVIGAATRPIEAGEHVHVHNLAVAEFTRDAAFGVDVQPLPEARADLRRTIQGIRRPDGRAATRNYVGIITSVNSSATVARLIADQFRSLAEYPTVDGAEHLLTRRAVSPEVGKRLLDRIRWWARYTAGDLDANPPPGNKAGGLTTILERSLGAVAKGGRAALYEYAEPVRHRGFVFTGRGSVFGCKPVPSLKLATTSELYQNMRDDMDVDCGPLVDGSATVEEIGRRIYHAVVCVASGERTASERLGFGADEFVPSQLGAVR